MTQPPPLNPFDPSATDTHLFATIRDALSAIPDGHTHALILDGTWSEGDGATALLSFMQKAPDGWNVVLNGGYDGPHGAQGSVQLAKSW